MKIVVVIIALSLIYACSKEEYFTGREQVVYKVELQEFEGDLSVQDGLSMFIAKEGSDSYLFERKTNSDGIVDFGFLEPDVDYKVFGSVTLNNIVYSVKKDVSEEFTEDTLSLILRAQTDEFNLLRIKCFDNIGGVLPTVDLCLFQSSYLADSADCLASVYSQESNSKGEANFWNITPGTYFLGVKDTVGGFPVSYKEEYVIPEFGVLTDSIVLIP